LWLIHNRSCRCLRLRVPMAIEHSPESDCILRGLSTQATYFTLQRPHFSKLLS
jgi:hypothetical protein